MVPAPGPLLDRHLCGPAGGIDGAGRQEPPPGRCRWPGATPHRRLSGTRRGSPHQCASAVPVPQTPRAVSLSSSPSYRKTVSDPVRVVVVTPVRNEAWILERFLSVTSRFADHIIVADQRSSDDSRAICSRYPKVTVIDNPTDEFNERDRQLLLLRQARAPVPPPRAILAPDADEILAAHALDTARWRAMLAARPGTIVCFERGDLYETADQCMRRERLAPPGDVDDGLEATPRDLR